MSLPPGSYGGGTFGYYGRKEVYEKRGVRDIMNAYEERG